jgi:hypothetical protein
MSGFFDLSNAAGLREKLRRDLGRLKAEPFNADAAFNFFVTAEHMLDWVFPKHAGSKRRGQVRAASAVLRVCSHLANGAKHFEVEDPRHDSVAGAGVAGGVFPTAIFPPAVFPNAVFGAGRRMVVRVKGKTAGELGSSIGVVELAEKVLAYWDAHPLT